MLKFIRSNNMYDRTSFVCEIESDQITLEVYLDSQNNTVLNNNNIIFHGALRSLPFDGFTYNIAFCIQNQRITSFNVNYAYGNSNIPKLTQTTIQKLIEVVQEKLPMKDITINNISLLKGLIALRTDARTELANNLSAIETEITAYNSMLTALEPPINKKPIKKKTK